MLKLRGFDLCRSCEKHLSKAAKNVKTKFEESPTYFWQRTFRLTQLSNAAKPAIYVILSVIRRVMKTKSGSSVIRVNNE